MDGVIFRMTRGRDLSFETLHGMPQARQQGIYVGRSAGGESVNVSLARDTSQRVVVVSRDDPGGSIRQAAQVAGVSINTVRKVTTAVGHTFD